MFIKLAKVLAKAVLALLACLPAVIAKDDGKARVPGGLRTRRPRNDVPNPAEVAVFVRLYLRAQRPAPTLVVDRIELGPQC